MKRFLFIISLLILLLTFNSVVFGANEIINVSMNGSKVQVKEVKVLMDGQAFKSDVPSFIYIDRTLVPIRFVAESFGAEVGWDQATKTATVKHKDKVVKLTIDSNKVVLNNEAKTLDKNSIPKLVTFSNNDSRTMVPVRFISEVLGYEVGWDENNQMPYINSSDDIEVIDLNPIIDPETPTNPTTPSVPASTATIDSINVVKGSTSKQRVVIKSNQPIDFEPLFLPDSNKLIIDIEDAVLKTSDSKEIKVNDGYIRSVTYSQYDNDPYVTRIVVQLEDKSDYDFYTSSDGKTNVLTFEEFKFNNIEIEKVDGVEALVIDDVKGIEYNVMNLKNPERIVIDLMDTNLTKKISEFNLQTGFIKNVRVSQFSGDNNYSPNDRIVRLVLDVQDGTTNPNVSIERDGDKLIIKPEKSIWEFITYDSTGTDRLISIKNNDSVRYDVNYDSSSKRMDIIIPSEDSDLVKSMTALSDNFIRQIQVNENGDDTIVSIYFVRGIEFEVLSDKRAEVIKIAFRRDPNLKYDGTIVIDAGHGGKDPGAISSNGTQEKVVNLQIALKVQRLLEDLGFNVIMTRTDDTFVDLYERANIANRNNADLFVSIHHNSTLNKAVQGLEILYCPRGSGVGKTADQYPLAEIISKSILQSTGGIDRGIIQRPGLVVIRETKMPAVLVEVGYLSNAEEEARIINDGYQNKVAQGIISGIQNYLDMY
jgi:N-acetylmuramoyl-L-alanine amidase